MCQQCAAYYYSYLIKIHIFSGCHAMDESCRLSSVEHYCILKYIFLSIHLCALPLSLLVRCRRRMQFPKMHFSAIPTSPADAMAHKLHRKIKICESIDTAQRSQTLTFMAIRRCSVLGIYTLEKHICQLINGSCTLHRQREEERKFLSFLDCHWQIAIPLTGRHLTDNIFYFAPCSYRAIIIIIRNARSVRSASSACAVNINLPIMHLHILSLALYARCARYGIRIECQVAKVIQYVSV